MEAADVDKDQVRGTPSSTYCSSLSRLTPSENCHTGRSSRRSGVTNKILPLSVDSGGDQKPASFKGDGPSREPKVGQGPAALEAVAGGSWEKKKGLARPGLVPRVRSFFSSLLSPHQKVQPK